MNFATLILGYVILFQTFDIKSLGIEWVLSVISMSLTFYSGYATNKKIKILK